MNIPKDAQDATGFFLVIIRELVAIKSQTHMNQLLLERVLARQGDTSVQISALVATLKIHTEAVAVKETVHAMKDVFPNLPDDIFSKYGDRAA